MLIRVVIVLLVVLNLGAGAWWALRPAPREPVVAARVPGIALLEIVPASQSAMGIATGIAASGSTMPAATSDIPPSTLPPAAPPSVAMQCASFGPFATPALAQAAQGRIASSAAQVRTRTAAAPGRGWRVLIPPAADAAQAAALATRIGAAGITDYFVMREGVDTNAIALGRYGNETAARRRAQALVEAGFAAQAEPVGAPSHWLDVASADAALMAELRTRSGAPRMQPLDCTALGIAAAS